jgi:hypothetical protein
VEDVAAGRRLSAWLPPVVWAAALLVLSAQPGDRLPAPGLWQIDKLVHACLYGLLGALTGRALARSGAAGWALAAAALGLVAFGVLDEWSQTFSPGRSSSAADAVADAIGSWGGLAAASRYYRRRHGTHPRLRR